MLKELQNYFIFLLGKGSTISFKAFFKTGDLSPFVDNN